MKAILHFKGRGIVIEGIKKCNVLGKAIGLMFKRREKASALLFDFAKEGRHAIHSFFVFFPFLAIWLDGNNNISEYKIVHPFISLVLPKASFLRLIEIPLNERYRNVLLLIQSASRLPTG
ncbi:MAG TPA: hypothetical protein VJA86_03515 [Candidatus Nanoarchaeia archaeon]|nr:hypothetical protein [Candidatus Nanoarchaeia archaeon]